MITFEEFTKKNLPYKIPEHMKPIIKLVGRKGKFCICLHRQAGWNTIKKRYKEYIAEYKIK